MKRLAIDLRVCLRCVGRVLVRAVVTEHAALATPFTPDPARLAYSILYRKMAGSPRVPRRKEERRR